MRKINVGLLGAGICANTFHLPALQKLSEKYNLVAMAGANPEQNKEYAQKAGISKTYTDYRDLIQDSEVEAVISSYPYYLNNEIIAEAKAAHKHVLVEKPIAESIDKGLHMAALDDGSVVMGVAENWIYWSVIDVIKQQIDSGAIGKPMTAQLYSYYNIDLDNQYLRGNAWRRSAVGGMILDRTIHPAALMRMIFGPVLKVTGTACGIRDELGKIDTMNALLEYESGIKASIMSCASAPGIQMPFSLAIIGTDGTITVSDIMTKVSVTNSSGTTVIKADNGDGGYYNEFVDFYNAIVNGAAFKSDLKGACNDLFTVMTALEAPGEWHVFNEGKTL